MKVAVHEAGHAYIYYKSGKKPSYLTVVSRGHFVGYMQPEYEEDKGTCSKEEFLWMIRTSLAGRVAEQVVFGEDVSHNTGASQDLVNASSKVIAMLTKYGMYEENLFAVSMNTLMNSPLSAEYVKKAEHILEEQKQICIDLITEGKDKIIKLAETAVDKTHLNFDEIEKIIKSNS